MHRCLLLRVEKPTDEPRAIALPAAGCVARLQALHAVLVLDARRLGRELVIQAGHL